MNTTPAPLAAGQEILSFCTKCKMDLAHTIMSMKGANPARVICRTCKSEHNFKAKKGVKEPGAAKTRAPRTPKADKVVPVEIEWQKQMSSSSKAVKSYATNESFQLGDRISHPSFGEGIVQKLIYPNKLEILFQMDIKTLIHAGKAA